MRITLGKIKSTKIKLLLLSSVLCNSQVSLCTKNLCTRTKYSDIYEYSFRTSDNYLQFYIALNWLSHITFPYEGFMSLALFNHVNVIWWVVHACLFNTYFTCGYNVTGQSQESKDLTVTRPATVKVVYTMLYSSEASLLQA